MTHYMIEVALWILLFFFIGCVAGYLLHLMLGGGKGAAAVKPEADPAPPVSAPVQAVTSEAPPAASPQQAAPVQAELPAAAARPATVSAVPQKETAVMPESEQRPAARMERPKGLEQPRGGKADPLQRISGIGPKNEKILHNLGFFHFDQIAQWTGTQIAWVDDHLKFNGRIGREEWVEQARLLAAGDTQEFERRYGRKKK